MNIMNENENLELQKQYEKAIPKNKMGTMPVNQLLLSMSIPMVVSMLVQALYNIVDSIFVAQINEEALTAVSLVFPIQNLLIAVGAGTAVGVNAVLSKALGENKREKVNRAADNGIYLAILNYFVFLLIGIFASGIFFRTQTTDPLILQYGVDYMQICCCFSFGIFGQLIFERLLMSTGRTLYSMISQSVGAVVNIILDPILIFGLFHAPALGVKGAAIATVIGQVCGACTALAMNLKVNHDIKLSPFHDKPDFEMIKKIYSVGVPSIIMQAIGSIMTYGMNRMLISFSTTATAVFGVYFKLQSFIFMPIFGLNNGIVPIVAFNFGAGNKDRLLKAMRLGIYYALGIMAIGVFVFQVFPRQLLAMFDASDYMMEIGVYALRIISLCFLFAAFSIVNVSVFQALGNGIFSMFVSIVRQLVVLLPVAYLLSRFGGLNAIWWAFPIAEFTAVLMCIYFFRKLYQKELVNLEPIQR